MEQTRAVVVSTACEEADFSEGIGEEAYPYYLAGRAFAPLLARWAPTIQVTRPESRLDHALWRARLQNGDPLHLTFLPLRSTYLSQRAPNAAFCYCAFPDLPNTDLAANPRNNYASLANHLALILAPNTFSRQAFLKAGVKTPIHLVPVPVASSYFDLPVWESGQRTVLDCPCYVFPPPAVQPPPSANPWIPAGPGHFGLRGGIKHIYKTYIRSRIGAGLDRKLCLARRVLAAAYGSPEEDAPISYPVSPGLDIAGIVYATIINPLDSSENWQDILSAFLVGLGDREDAMLVMKVAASPRRATRCFNILLRHYQKLGLRHRCKLAVITSYLTDGQMVELTRAAAYYVQATRAEGLGLPLQRFLAAARPGISPAHTAMMDYFSDDLGFVVAAHPEPACWPYNSEERHTTTWHRIVWQSLYDQFQLSYAVAREDRARYLNLGRQARAAIQTWAGADSVWPRLAAALASVRGSYPVVAKAS